MKKPDLHCVIHTESTILVNGVRLTKGEPGKRAYGRVYTGDEITVLQPTKEGKGLRFTCEFFHGEARNTRPGPAPFKVEISSSSDSAKSSHESRGSSGEENAVAAAA